MGGFLVLAAAVGMTLLFWPKLWQGGGLIGGDTYTYYFPQKTALADALRQGQLPLWNSIVSLGYPQLAESQTGALYPLNLVLYRFLSVNAAYNASHLLHYVAAYVFSWLLARRFGLKVVGAHLAALSFVYGWFPPRACLEWAIFGGAYFSLIVWCVESFLQSAKTRWLAFAAIALGLFLTTGHFNLAFITLLLSAMLIVSRLIWVTSGVAASLLASRRATVARWIASVALGFALAAPQLLPSAELKSVSQREGTTFNQSYGHIPAWYLTQPLWPTLWYAPDINPDARLNNSNRIEAHLYFGVIPFYLAVIGVFWRPDSDAAPDRRLRVFGMAAVLGVILATGYLMPVLRFVPGFGYFAGPGRYGMLTALGVALAGGHVLDRVLSRPKIRGLWPLIAAGCLAITIYDLSYVTDCVTYLTFVDHPPIAAREESPLRELFMKSDRPVRVFAPGANLPTLTGLNCVPEYLGIGPKQYYDPQLAIPRYDSKTETPEQRETLIRWLQNAGVTHVLAQSPLDETAWPVSRATAILDPLLNAAWGRGRDPLYLYELKNGRARAFVEGHPDGAGVTVRDRDVTTVTITVETAEPGRLVLLEMPYPGWQVKVDGRRGDAGTFEGQFRSVNVSAGTHVVEWTYEPRSFRWGLLVGVFAAAGLLGWMLWERRLIRQFDSALEPGGRSSR